MSEHEHGCVSTRSNNWRSKKNWKRIKRCNALSSYVGEISYSNTRSGHSTVPPVLRALMMVTMLRMSRATMIVDWGVRGV